MLFSCMDLLFNFLFASLLFSLLFLLNFILLPFSRALSLPHSHVLSLLLFFFVSNMSLTFTACIWYRYVGTEQLSLLYQWFRPLFLRSDFFGGRGNRQIGVIDSWVKHEWAIYLAQPPSSTRFAHISMFSLRSVFYPIPPPPPFQSTTIARRRGG